MCSLDGTYDTARELLVPGKTPSLKVALWAAALSPQKQLAWNGAQVQALLPYADRPLPQDPEQVWHIIRSGHAFATRRNAQQVLAIEALERAGELAELERQPRSAREWLLWRLSVAKLPGFSYKTASFAALLMWPLECPLVPVDVHVCSRLGVKDLYECSSRNYKVYRFIERLVSREWRAAGKPYTLGIWHWYKWSEWRQAIGKEPARERPESHLALTPYVLPCAA